MVENGLRKILYIFILFFIFIPFVSAASLKISDIELVDKSDGTNLDNINYSNNLVDSSIIFSEVDNYVTFDIVFYNEDSTEYELLDIIDNNDNLSISYDENSKILGNNVSKIRVTIKNDKDLINENELVINDYSLAFNFNPREIINPVTNSIINPNTKDNIYLMVIFLFISIIAFVILYKVKRKNYWVFLICLIPIPIIAYASNTVRIDLTFSNNTIKGRFLSYLITVNNNGNTSSFEKTFGETIGNLDVPNRDGYNFEGWFNENDEEITEDTVVSEKMSIEARYSLINYSISYNLDDGSLDSNNPLSYTVEDSFILNNPSKQGFDFIGWSEGNSNEYSTNVVINVGTIGSKSYVAHFKPSNNTSYTVKHIRMDTNGEYTIIETINCTGTTNDVVTPPVKTYEGFNSPSAAQLLIEPNGEASITYNYERQKRHLYLADAEYIETDTPSGEYYYGTSITLKAIDREGFEFTYWDDWATDQVYTFELVSDKYIGPCYDALQIEYTIYYYLERLNGSYELEDTYTDTAPYGDEFDASLNDYYGFDYPNYQTLTIGIDPNNNVVKYYYKRSMFSLNIINADKVTTSTPSGSYPYGTQITLTAKDVRGWTFEYWSDYGDDKTITFTLESNTSIEPYYSEKYLYIEFDGNGGYVSEWSKDVRDGEPIGELPTADDNYGYKFVGWYTEADGGNKIESSYIPDEDMYLYAHWEELQNFTINFNPNGGSIDDTELTVTELSPIGYIPVAIRDNYALSGWYTGITDGIRVDENFIVSDNMNLYARWVPTISSASIPDSITVKTNESESINITNASELESFSFIVNDDKTATVDNNGLVTGVTVGSTIVKTTGLLSGQTKDVKVYVITDDIDTYTITFDANEGQVNEVSREVYDGMSIGELPVPTKSDNSFGGWVDEDTGDIYVSSTVPTKDVTLTAEWNIEDYVARINDVYYVTLQAAFDNAYYEDEIYLLKDITENTVNYATVTLNLDKHRIFGTIENSGTLTILNGEIEYDSNVIHNTGNLIVGSENSSIDDGVYIHATCVGNVGPDFDPEYEYAVFPSCFVIYSDDTWSNNARFTLNKGSVVAVGYGSYMEAYSVYGQRSIMNDGSVMAIAPSANSFAAGIYNFFSDIDQNGGAIMAVSPNHIIGLSGGTGSLNLNGGNIKLSDSSTIYGAYSIAGTVSLNGTNMFISNSSSVYAVYGNYAYSEDSSITMNNVDSGDVIYASRGGSFSDLDISVSNSGSVGAIGAYYDSYDFTNINITFTNVEYATGIVTFGGNGSNFVENSSISFDNVTQGTAYRDDSGCYVSVNDLDITAVNSGKIIGINFSGSSLSVTGGSFNVTSSTSATGIDTNDKSSLNITNWTVNINVTGNAYGVSSSFNSSVDLINNNINIVSTQGSVTGALVMNGQLRLSGGTFTVTGYASATALNGTDRGPVSINIPEIIVTCTNGVARGIIGKSISLTNLSLKIKGNTSANTIAFYWGGTGGASVSAGGRTVRQRSIANGYTEYYLS